jgi:hypothetical protein
MWKVFLLAISFHGMQGQSMDCSNMATTQTKAVVGPAGVTALLKVYSADDHSKNSHDCKADYTLVITPADGIGGEGFFSSDADWGRRLSVHLDGFSQDSKHVLGIVSEGGKYSFAMVFDYDRTIHNANVIGIQRGLMHLRAAKCGTAFAVAGITDTGGIVLEPNSTNPCRGDHRWLLDQTGKLQNLVQDRPFIRLYKEGSP